MKPVLARLCCLIVLCLLPAVSFLRAAEPVPASDLPADPAVHWGRLDNGLRYALLANHEPRGRASLRFTVAAGSLHETDRQLGLAHFLEHMAFNGSKNFPAGTLVEYFQRLGMSFGGDTNASTGFDRTIYLLELPDTKPETFEKAFTLFADYAGGLALDQGEIDKERGIILSEKRARDSIGFRQFIGEFNFLLPQSRFIHRIPIGTEEIISKAQRAEFADFYDAWYRPENIHVVAVGDFDPAAVEPILKKLLSPLAGRGPARAAPDLGRIDSTPGLVTRLLTEMEAPAVTLSIQTIQPYAYEADTAANRLKYLPRTLALSMLNRRFAILAKKEGAPFLSGSINVGEQYDFFRNASVELTCKPETWREALATGEQELRRALQYGFQSAELAEAVANMRNALEQDVRMASTRRSEGLADELSEVILDRNVFTTPATDLALYQPALAKVTVDDCLAALRAAFDDHLGRRLWVTGNLTLADPDKEIVAAYEASRAVAVAPSEKIAEAAFGYTNFGPAGTVARQSDVADLQVTLVEFQNGVRLNLKKTDFEAGRIRVGIRIGAGKLIEPTTQSGLGFLAKNVFLLGGLGRHSADDLQRLLAGRTVGSAFNVGNDAFSFGGTTNQADLLLQLQLLCAYVTDPGYRPESIRQIKQHLGPFYAQLAHIVEGPLQTEVPRLLASGDPRFGIPSETELSQRTLDEVRNWLAPEFASGPIEIAIVGDLEPAVVIDNVARTFGALPPRKTKPPYATERHVDYPATPLNKQYTVATEIPKGIVQLYWGATDSRDVRLSRRINLLVSVLEDRLRVKIREQMGGSYSPDAVSSLSDAFTGYGLIATNTTVAPAEARAIADAIKECAADLFAHGVTDEELVRAKQPILTAIKQSARTNPYWLGTVLSSAQEFPERLEWSRTRYADTEGITAAELTDLARRFLDPAKASEFISLPAANLTTPPAGSPMNPPAPNPPAPTPPATAPAK